MVRTNTDSHMGQKKNKENIENILNIKNIFDADFVNQNLKDLYEERAGIMEYDGGLNRKEAEREALNVILEGEK